MKPNFLVTNNRKIDAEENDYYATDPQAIDDLLMVESFKPVIFEPCVGGGHLAERLREYGYGVIGHDIVDRGWPGTQIVDIFDVKNIPFDVITNPPFKIADKVIRHIIECNEDLDPDRPNKIAMFLKLTFLESQKRYDNLFKDYPPRTIYVYKKRIACYKNGDFDKYKSNAVSYCRFVWESGFKGKPEIEWI